MSQCFHCQDECRTEEINFNGKIFCCTGCQSVYEILNGFELHRYYQIDAEAGIKPKSELEGKYDFLDIEKFQKRLILFREGTVSKVRFFLPQIHCSSCLWLLERLHKIRPEIIGSQVNFVEKDVVITYNHDKINLKEVAELLATIGYPPNISMKDYEEGSKKNVNRKLYLQIGVAGFCFGNIMLLSFPEYLGIDESDANFQRTFNYLNLVLALPVLIYAAKDYLLSAFKALRSKIINIDVPISLGVIALFSRSLFEIVSGSGAGYFDSFSGLIFFLLVGKWFQQKTYLAINFERDYKSYFPMAVSRIDRNAEQTVALKELQVGDKLRIRNNELIPADAVLLKGRGNIDYSFVSGESSRISKNEGDMIYAGGRQDGASIDVEVLRQVENSYLTSLWNNPVFSKVKRRVSLSDRLAKHFTIAVIVIAVIGGIVWNAIDPSRAAFVVTSVLIIACPCAIALSVPFTYGNGIRILGRNSVYLKSGDVIEPITEVTDIVFDKTGTITYNDRSEIKWKGETLSGNDKRAIYNLCRQSAHPLSRELSEQLKTDNVEVISFREEVGKGISAKVEDAVWMVGSADFVGSKKNDHFTRVFIWKNGIVLGSFCFSNAYRSGLKKLFDDLKEKYHIHILSGDNDSEREKLKRLLPEDSELHFNQSPEDKLNYVEQLQIRGRKVMMIGDGLNDAGALKRSDVGFSVVDDVYAFTPSSDGILDSKRLSGLKSILNFAGYNKKVVLWSYGFSLMYNTIGLYFALTGMLTPLVAAILMPLSSISVVLLVTLLTNLKGREMHGDLRERAKLKIHQDIIAQ